MRCEYTRVLTMSGFIKKTLHHIDAWQDPDYTSGSAYTGLHNVLSKMLQHRCLTGFQYSSGSEHETVLNMPRLLKVLNKTLHLILDRVLNMRLVLKWQVYRKFCVNCILEIHSILNIPQVLNIPRFCMYQGS